ncbi:MAG: TraR/DksA C4-type zinc finger protein [Gammaproteobacteria bacterium]|nr:TraR/DksA C4-type zinc finger protein [Gammaproteobacteria bacterium]
MSAQSAPISENDIREYKQALTTLYKALRQEVSRELLKSDEEHFVDLATQVNDIAERSVADLLVDINLAHIDRHIIEIRAIENALIRLQEGKYGLCSDCEQAIPDARLKANPAAQRCLDCQKVHEHRYAQPGHASI